MSTDGESSGGAGAAPGLFGHMCIETVLLYYSKKIARGEDMVQKDQLETFVKRGYSSPNLPSALYCLFWQKYFSLLTQVVTGTGANLTPPGQRCAPETLPVHTLSMAAGRCPKEM